MSDWLSHTEMQINVEIMGVWKHFELNCFSLNAGSYSVALHSQGSSEINKAPKISESWWHWADVLCCGAAENAAELQTFQIPLSTAMRPQSISLNSPEHTLIPHSHSLSVLLYLLALEWSLEIPEGQSHWPSLRITRFSKCTSDHLTCHLFHFPSSCLYSIFSYFQHIP